MITIMIMMIILKMFFFFSCPLHSGASSGLLCLRHFPGSSSSLSSLLPLPLLSSILPSLLSPPQGLRHHRHHRRRLSRVYHLPPKGSLHHHKHHYHIACHRINIMAMIICHDRLPFTMIVKICFP